MTARKDAAKRCKAKTKRGARCTRVPFRELDVCLAHAPAEVRESRGFIAANGRGGRKPRLKPDAIMRQLMQDGFLLLHRAHFATLGLGVEFDADGNHRFYELAEGGARLHGTNQKDGSITMSDYPDLSARVAVAEKLFDRNFGKPRQAVSVTGEGGGPIMLRLGELMTLETAKLASELAARLAVADEEGTARLSSELAGRLGIEAANEDDLPEGEA